MKTTLFVLRSLSLSMLLLLVGCGGGGAWRRVETPHFVLSTDLDESDAMRSGVALEETRDALVSAAWPQFPFPKEERTEVFVLSNGLDFEHTFSKMVDGIFFHGSPPMAFLHGSPSRWELRRSAHQPTNSVLRHEMAHDLASKVFPSQPRWFAEGLAQFLEAVYYSDDEKSVVLGGANMVAYADYRAVRTTTVSDTLAWSQSVSTLTQSDAIGLYGTSWFLFHWLYNTQTDAFGRYQEELARQGSTKAFGIAFPRFDADKANRDLYEYMQHGKFNETELPLVHGDWSAKAFSHQLLTREQVAAVKTTLDEAGKAFRNKGKTKS